MAEITALVQELEAVKAKVAELEAALAKVQDTRTEARRNFARLVKGGLDERQEKQQEQETPPCCLETTVAVLEVRPTKKGGIRAWCQDTETGEKVAVYAKDAAGKKLAESVRKKVRIHYRALDAGWYTVKVS
ncbi:MAG: Uncharacterized protein XD69_0174 [Clostridia bacterium 62_21]|nr:MAG: Uncharacterized protein XD69_0174 [Clostridia bacterium 62_21]HAG07663.1 hypothetical protein [Peptococcaceae bacterium]